MSNFNQNRYITELVTLDELRATLPDVYFALRVLISDGDSIWLNESSASLDVLLNSTAYGLKLLKNRDDRLLAEAAQHRDVFLFCHPKGLACYAASLFCGECFLGVLVSSSFCTENAARSSEVMAKRFHLPQ